MERFGLFGTMTAWMLNLVALGLEKMSYLISYLAFLQEIETLQRMSYYLAISVSIVTLMWYAGNMIIRRKELAKALKELFKAMFHHKEK